jgi:hypothetical protein
VMWVCFRLAWSQEGACQTTRFSPFGYSVLKVQKSYQEFKIYCSKATNGETGCADEYFVDCKN